MAKCQTCGIEIRPAILGTWTHVRKPDTRHVIKPDTGDSKAR
jgi:hypothetical protein